MNDGGRPQELDLRTGKRTRSASPLYYPQQRTDINRVPTLEIELKPNRPWSAVQSDQPTADLSPYSDKQGWALPRRAWLIVRVPFNFNDPDNVAHGPITAQTLGLSVTLADGSSPSGSWSHAFASSLSPTVSQQQINGVFDVPESLHSAILTIAPPTPFSVDGTNLSGPRHIAIRFHR